MKLNYQLFISTFILTIYFIIPSVVSLFELQAAITVAQYGFKFISAIANKKSADDELNWRHEVLNTLSDILNATKRVEILISVEANRIIDELSLKSDMKLVREFIDSVHYINKRYEKKFMKYYFNNTNLPSDNEYFLNEMLMEDSNFKIRLNKISEIIVPSYALSHLENIRLFDTLLKFQDIKHSHHHDCDEGISNHQQLYAVYNLAIISIIRGYSMIVHAYNYRPHRLENFRDITQEYRGIISGITKIARNAMKRASKIIYRCDPEEYKLGVTHTRLKYFLSAYVTSQNYMNSNDRCSGSCSSYNAFEPRPFRRYSKFSCSGTAYDCQSSSVVIMCSPEATSDRRYQGLQEWSWGTLSHYIKADWPDRCNKRIIARTDITGSDSLCDTCVCTCDDWKRRDGTRSFSLRSQYTKISEKRVITGIKFVERKGIISIEIQEGQVVNGTIDLNTVKWNPNASYPSPDGKDDVRLGYKHRSFNLDDIKLPPQSVVTGVKLNVVNDTLVLMVAGVRMYDKFGNEKDNWGKMTWYYSKDTSERKELTLSYPNLPTVRNSVNVEMSTPGQNYIKFQMTDWAKDASQTTVPYLDTQEIITLPSVPIGGIGIFFKGQAQTGGFLALKIISTDSNIHLNKKNREKIFSLVRKIKK